MEEYKKIMNIEEANKTVDEIILRLDQDQDGNIDYTEFLVSCADYQKVLSHENLKIAFQMFDTDGSGTITVDEIKMTLDGGQLADDEAWDLILKEADSNGDGCIDLKEFIELMQNIHKATSVKDLVKV